MFRNLHENYDKLTPDEKAFVDESFRSIYALAKHSHVPLTGNDDAEVAVDALAKLVIQSRK
jgi:hypothetical protein